MSKEIGWLTVCVRRIIAREGLVGAQLDEHEILMDRVAGDAVKVLYDPSKPGRCETISF